MKLTQTIMAMPVIVEIRDSGLDINKTKKDIEKVFKYFRWVDEKYSPFKTTSEVAKLNRGENVSSGMKKILDLCEETNKLTEGYFDITGHDGKLDPSGLVKGWAIKGGADILRKLGYKKFFVEIAGDTEIVGGPWKWGITNPFNKKQIVKVLKLENVGIATSGTYERGQHIWNPITKKPEITDIVSLTIIGTDVYEADRFATAAFAMGRSGINFIENLKDFEGYMVDSNGIATMTSGFKKYVQTGR